MLRNQSRGDDVPGWAIIALFWFPALFLMLVAFAWGQHGDGFAPTLYVAGLALFMAPFLIPVIGAWLRLQNVLHSLVVWKLDLTIDLVRRKVIFRGVIANNLSVPATGVTLHIFLHPRADTQPDPKGTARPVHEVTTLIGDFVPKQRRRFQRTFDAPPWDLLNIESDHHLDYDGHHCSHP